MPAHSCAGTSGEQTRIARLHDPGAQGGDRAQPATRAQRTSARRAAMPAHACAGTCGEQTRIARLRDPGAQGATAPNLPPPPDEPVHGAQAKPPEAAPGA
ncbi:hypothetical protein Rmf_13590 [Roseomonas fluvialis]|uniref:Uncharacterized protein n=1 Tax=Roseomonas fluvialis TaxID=1750527 RepID=A0ABM9SE58_9PROT|nr:hypothetical protein Rmf_13590 [Roseomonas fluvialis]